MCKVHWLSDIEAGRTIAAATFARLQSNPTFRNDLRAAQMEAQRLTAGGGPENCDAEAAALAAE